MLLVEGGGGEEGRDHHHHGGSRSRNPVGMAPVGSWRGEGHAVDRPGAALHAAPHVRQRRPLLRILSTEDFLTSSLSHLPRSRSTRPGAGGDGPSNHLLPGRVRRVHQEDRRCGGGSQGHLHQTGGGGPHQQDQQGPGRAVYQGPGARLHQRGRGRVRGWRPLLCADLHQRLRGPDPQGHAALLHERRVAAVHQDGAAGPVPALLCGESLHPAEVRGPPGG